MPLLGLLSFEVHTPESVGIIAVHRPGNDTGIKTAVMPYVDTAALASFINGSQHLRCHRFSLGCEKIILHSNAWHLNENISRGWCVDYVSAGVHHIPLRVTVWPQWYWWWWWILVCDVLGSPHPRAFGDNASYVLISMCQTARTFMKHFYHIHYSRSLWISAQFLPTVKHLM